MDLVLRGCVSSLLEVVSEDYSVFLVKKGRVVFYCALVVVGRSEMELTKARNLNKDPCNCKSLLEQQQQQIQPGLLVDPNIPERFLLKDGDILP